MNVKTLVFGVLTLFALVSCGKKSSNASNQNEVPAYPTAEVAFQNTQLESTYPVTIKGQEDVEIRPRIDGFIEEIFIDEGAVVKKGQVLFKINSPKSDQDYNTALATMSSVEAQINTAKLNVDRFRPLAEEGIVSPVQLQTYENALKVSLAAKDQAEAVLKNAREALGWATVTSPVNGVVGSIPYRTGSLVNSQNVLTTVANTSNVFAYFSLNEKAMVEFLSTLEGNTQAEKIKNAPEVTLTLADGTVYPEKGKIETIAGIINVTTGSANFRAEFPNKEGNLRSGTSGKISIPRALEDVIVIPQKSTFAQQDKILVYKVQADSVVQQIITVLPTPDGKSYAVTSGLNQGERIVTDGVLTLTHGMKIKAQNN